MKTRIPRIGLWPILWVLLFYGLLSCTLHFPPYRFISTLYHRILDVETGSDDYLKTDVAALITIRQPADASRLRSELISLLWGNTGLPTALPSTVVSGFPDSRYDDIATLQRIDKLVVQMEFGLQSNLYHFIPKTPNNKVVLYHQGHDGDFYNGKEQIRTFLNHGYSVVAFSMPLFGLNNQPTVNLARQGTLKLTSHDHMAFLSPENGHPIKYFIEPVVIALNYLQKHFNYTSSSMVGISGGGWTTTLAAALDTRIARSFPVAGSYPIYLRATSTKDWSDYEQTDPKLYNTVNYLDLYVLGSYGTDRKQLQVINKYDPCCYSGTKGETYKDFVRSRVRDLASGEFDLFVDASHREHAISELAMSRILSELGK